MRTTDRKFRQVAAAAFAFAIAGCGMGIAAGADYAPGLDLGGHTSFVWDEPDARPVGDPRLENNPFFEQRLHGAIAAELASYGIRERAAAPDLIVHHHATVRSRVDVYEADERAGYAPVGAEGRTQVIQFDEGTILVDIADAESKTILWRGWAQFDIGRALSEPEVMAQAIEEAIRSMFEDFPVR